MTKFFNVAGPCRSEKHYMLDTQARCVELLPLVEREEYFVLHAARQTGKTTIIQDFVDKLNEEGKYYALYCSLESLEEIGEAEKAIPEILSCLFSDIKHSPLPSFEGKEEFLKSPTHSHLLIDVLSHYCASLDRPLVVMFDEADCLSNGALVSFLRQLRKGYVNRSRTPFIHSLALIGMRSLRDYKNRIRESKETLGSASPFNIVKKALTLSNFTDPEITELYQQHTKATGQRFEKEVVGKIFHYTEGQPWLVNAIACEIVEEILENDFEKEIITNHVDQAVQNLIERRDTHIDSLISKLKEERVRSIVEPAITGDGIEIDYLDDDFRYVLDLGLMKNDNGEVKPANPIYSEVIMQILSYNYQYRLDASLQGMFIQDGKLDCTALLKEFREFWQENSEIWVEKYQYKEAAPHLILQAYFQRVLHSGGKIHREYASGRGRIDLCIELKENRYPIELKIRYGKKTRGLGLKQLEKYMDQLGLTEGWLILFDRRKTVSWSEKLTWEIESIEEKTIHVVGC